MRTCPLLLGKLILEVEGNVDSSLAIKIFILQRKKLR